MKKQTGASYIKVVIFVLVLFVVVYLAIKYAGKPVSQVLNQGADTAKSKIDKAQDAANTAAKAAEEVIKKARDAAE
ncbi:MAG: hypothetical protein A2452_03920 [Candidatus Firestonebacteria bacterium RIFOXYC2_FULL_39_67]|nr:MAG: hypothetical protein A2536_08655 [Candidatus Firestonebacteria bacterium RIFOXYD2_FULL_39_29]OGF54710.1 MAG: hypothetical protein A2452_03920 [Candidatus Firestonebacteria bacterium RIFOXYC2_FULL_39_67]OGF57896.1 MAG: hypothetical protein A2497_04260 [Candidatus Firestonebacteria bacterium RifOxyC12_full_39_7]